MLQELRRGRYGYLLGLHVLLLCAHGYSPSVIAEFLFCSRTSVYRIAEGYRTGKLALGFDAQGVPACPVRTTVLAPHVKRSLLALLKKSPPVFGWCRTRWSCATLALELETRRGIQVSAETMRRWLHEIGWVWKRAKLVARDDDPGRVTKLARIRLAFERAGKKAAFFFADELDLHLLPKVGYEWTETGSQRAVMTPGTNQKTYLAGALDIVTGKVWTWVADRKTSVLFLALLQMIEAAVPHRVPRIYLVVDNFKIHHAKAVTTWLADHPRVTLLFLPSYCPQANPIERVFGDVHDKCTRNHKRTRLDEIVTDVKEHFEVNGPWKYQLSEIYYTSAVTAEVERLAQLDEEEAAA